MLRKKRKIRYDLDRLKLVRRKNRLSAMYRRIKEWRRAGAGTVPKNDEKRVLQLK